MNKVPSQFDYIIIGGGSAGCVLANRLSANPSVQVCLLEAGPPDSSFFLKMPLVLFIPIRSKKYNWHYWTVPQKNCFNRSMFWPRGRTLGGSSSINAMCYVRGNSSDYDRWASLGCEGWTFDEVLPYFLKMENFVNGANQYHGVNGPLTISKPIYLNPLMHAFVQAGQEAGLPFVDDYNGEQQAGVGYFYVTEKDGQRFSNARGYLHPILNRPNLTVLTHALVTKIIFTKKVATAICYVKKNQHFQLKANREIILSAGAINSPQILMLSGVGPRTVIQKHGIDLVHHLPGVGANLQDHLDIHISCLDRTRTSISFRISWVWRLINGLYQYLFKGTGELTSNYTQAVAFAKSNPDLPEADLQWHFGASLYSNSGLNLKPVFKYYGYTLMVCHLRPKSRGTITLKDTNPYSKPLIDPNYLAIESDLEALVIGFKKSRDILKQAALKPFFLSEYEPGSSIQTDDQIKAYIRANAETIYHPIGTCKMGIDEMSVVDPKSLKIYGLENIRVIDASIMPTLISGNTNAPTTMIAERGAAMIVGEQF